jgi:hypothetical protein
MRLATHSLQFLDGHVVALALLDSSEREVRKRAHDDCDRNSEAQVSTGWHVLRLVRLTDAVKKTVAGRAGAYNFSLKHEAQ